MSNDKKFNIRIKFNPKDLKTDLKKQSNEPDYIYHWPRIIVAVILTFGIIGVGFYYINKDTNADEQVSKQSALSVQLQNNESSTAVKILPDNTDDLIDKIKQAPQENNTPITSTNEISKSEKTNKSTSLTKEAEINKIEEKEIVTASLSDNQSKTAPLTTQQTSINDQTVTESPNLPTTNNKQIEEKPQSNDNIITEISSTEATVQEVNETSVSTVQQQLHPLPIIFKLTHIEIYSPQISRFVIAKNVNDKEPVGTVEDIQFDENNIATVYAYSDAIGFADKFLYYEWRLNGKEIAMIEIGAWGDRWRSYTRKFIQPNKRGDWTVTLRNEAGEKLAIAEFTY